MKQTETKHVGVGFCDLLALLFIALKLLNVITWSWVWVLAPIWIPAIFVIFIIVIAVILVR